MPIGDPKKGAQYCAVSLYPGSLQESIAKPHGGATNVNSTTQRSGTTIHAKTAEHKVHVSGKAVPGLCSGVQRSPGLDNLADSVGVGGLSLDLNGDDTEQQHLDGGTAGVPEGPRHTVLQNKGHTRWEKGVARLGNQVQHQQPGDTRVPLTPHITQSLDSTVL